MSTPSFSDPVLLPGEILSGCYRIERVLGEGGMGVVLAARNLELGESVAIKVLNRAHTPELARRFLGEAKAAARIRSDHVVRILNFGRTDQGCPFIVMEYLEGQDLGQVLAKSGAVPVPMALRWTLQACEALAHAHALGIVHRDLKPANLFLERRTDGSRRLKLLDFGIAKLPSNTELTHTSQLLGSPNYMAPEQLDNPKDVDSRTDIWGLGIVLYELLTGQKPFAAPSVFALAARIRDTEQAPAASLRPELPEGLSALVDKCLEKQRDARWPDIAALARALSVFAPDDAGPLVRSIQGIVRGSDADGTFDGEEADSAGKPADTQAQPSAPRAEQSAASASIAAHSDLHSRRRSPLSPRFSISVLLALGAAAVGAGLLFVPTRAEIAGADPVASAQPPVVLPTPAPSVSEASSGEIPAPRSVTALDAGTASATQRARPRSVLRRAARERPREAAPKPPEASPPLAPPRFNPGF